MILNNLKAHLGNSEPITRKFVELMDATFSYYGETRSLFFDKLPQHLLQSELVSLVNVEIKSRLFDDKFCQGIQSSLQSFRRALIRLEDLREQHPGHPDQVNNLTRLAELGKKVESLYQKHWEFYRYQGRLNEEDLVGFLLEIDQVGYEWDNYISGFSAIKGLLEMLDGQPIPKDHSPLRVCYQRGAPHQFAVSSLRSLLNFLEVGYGFICAVGEMDAEETPLMLIQVEVADPIELQFAVPKIAAPAYRKFLQHLFLKDMLKREALLKVVFEEVRREMGREKALSPAVLTGFQRAMSLELKKLPMDGIFTISDRTFPDDGIRVLQEFTAALDDKNIRYDTLLRTESRKGSRAKPPLKAKEEAAPPPEVGRREEARSSLGSLLHPVGEKEHIAILTEKSTDR